MLLPDVIDLSKYRLEKAKMDFKAAQMLFISDMFDQSLNRSYYSIFHATRALLSLDKFDSKKHSGIIAYFNEHYVSTGVFEKEYSKILMGAERVRKQSDYDDFFIGSKDDAEKQIANAKKFIEKIENYIYKRIGKGE